MVTFTYGTVISIKFVTRNVPVIKYRTGLYLLISFTTAAESPLFYLGYFGKVLWRKVIHK